MEMPAGAGPRSQLTTEDTESTEKKNERNGAEIVWLFHEHGAALVLKSDNGAAFISEPLRRFLDGSPARLLLSPPYTPEYNGSIEAGNGALKTTNLELR